LVFVDREIQTRQIREAVDIVEIVGSYVTLKRSGSGGFKGLCPFHEEKTPSFHVNSARQIFKCFGCGAGGDVFKFVQLREKVDFPEARRILADRAGISLEQEYLGVGSSGPSKSDLAQLNHWAQNVFRGNYEGSAGDLARAYVAGRKISGESAQSFGLGYAVDSYDSLIRQASSSNVDMKLLVGAGLVKERSGGGYYDTFRHRLMFPIYDVNDRIVGFGGRSLGEDPAKYMNTPATSLFDKGSNLFGLDRARRVADGAGRIIVVEGYTDCIMAHQYGFTECVATLGTALTESHARIIRRYTERVILLFDSDEAGRRAADRALSATLSSGLDVVLAKLPEGKDPCDYLLSAGKTAFDSVLKVGVEALEFKWRQVSDEYNSSNTGLGRRRAIEAYLEQIASWVAHGAIDHIQKGLLLTQLSKILSLPPEDLHRQLHGMIKRFQARSTVRPGRAGDSDLCEFDRARSNAGQIALQQIVEVLLNKPELYPVIEEYFDPSLIQDGALSAVAFKLVEMLGSEGGFRLDELIGQFESADYGRFITDLQVRGESRGGYDEVLEGVKPCLESAEQIRRAALAAEEIRNQVMSEGSDNVESGLHEDERLRNLAESVKHPHFSTTKARRRFLV
jgi:DNA primase